ncbi:MAG: NEL-type E3 ubiquitin ligase domain-containing protein, partial [Rhabdochlamydiaceae bacterium]
MGASISWAFTSKRISKTQCFLLGITCVAYLAYKILHWHLYITKITLQNQLSVPDWVFQCSNLTSLTLSDCRLTCIPNTISNLSKLTHLDLCNNQLSTLPNEIGNLSKLTYLGLENNQLSTLPDSLLNLKSFCLIFATRNRFTLDTISALQNQVQSIYRENSARGPILSLSAYDASSQISVPKVLLPKLVTDWLKEYNTLFSQDPISNPDNLEPYQALLSHAEINQLYLFLRKLKETQDYKQQSSRNSVVLQVKQMITYAATHEEFREKLFKLLERALSTCGDRVSYYFNKIEIQRHLSQPNLTETDVAKILIGIRRKKLLHERAKIRVDELRLTDPLEVCLYYEIYSK